ncbi:bifunctional adenosylcobinamide kinase/adenosylcobinamide-phosphate guanylyltransferase [Segnochrobactrum spirostomi]|uniref:Bifunctional adenosylcobalamin biosynthesis protein n=1 Tax=Segnochrobactrum spirostomi TaxID=2608987 RepID=A0A6A7XZE6_9HYPH|nr:bifunctional adenosylcobinamide kinase/adenosylcobinamide-phosphate guanylyltransferase [Segnochrobactrum spirostomi]MQT11686.1 bifunctional adenosylcobinamide kinase/adenosylcobinamide-phosphate guanylyltransferase [Segnochrobactrum spirostomi]
MCDQDRDSAQGRETAQGREVAEQTNAVRPRLVLVTGGARSGKSAFAERVVRASGLERLYVATGEARDGEMAERIARHRAERGEDWRTLEVPIALAGLIAAEAGPGRIVLVDCLTLWLTNVMLADRPVEAEIEGLVAALAGAAGPVVLVSNEVGLGIVPDTPLGRRFRDAQGRLNRRVAEIATDAFFVAAGCPLRLKPAADPVAALWS